MAITVMTIKNNIRMCKVNTGIRCKFCNVQEFVWCGYKDRYSIYECRACNNHWKYGPEVLSMKQVPTHSGRCLVVFHGFWLEEEKNLVEVAFRVNEKTYDEWGFFRGRNLYTAWRFAEKKYFGFSSIVDSY